MDDIKKVLSLKSTRALYEIFSDPCIQELRPQVARELIKRVNVENSFVNQDLIYDCISLLSVSEALELTSSANSCVAFLANLNIENRIKDSKSSELFSSISARKYTRVKIKRRRSRLRDGD